MAPSLRVSPRLEIPETELSWKFSRSGGPGGQSVNTSDTQVELSFDVSRSPSLVPYMRERALERLSSRLVAGVITVVAHEHRSQWKNRRVAEQRLVEILAAAIAPPPPKRRDTKPSASARRARVDDKKRRGAVKRLRRSTDD